jgi:dsRNA-specific ribonuclease
MFNHINKSPVQSYKTTVQELVQKRYKQIPQYRDIEHDKDDKGNVWVYKSELYI